jgi:hypothetical protein
MATPPNPGHIRVSGHAGAVHMGHNMMLEPAWRDVAERICEWLAIKNL